MGQRRRHSLEPVATAALTVTAPGQVVRSLIHGQSVQFFIANPRDTIQKVHATGQFYEPEELEIIRQWCPPGAVFLDIGSNVGNHAIYALKFLHAARVILCEPNPAAIDILLTNLGLNGLLDRCDLSKLGHGLSDRNEGGMVIEASRRNLGGGRIKEADDAAPGSITLRRGDELLADITPTFVKIDVEGMEMSVLSGLTELVERSRPIFFVEVDNVNRAAFLQWVQDNGYATRARFRRYRANENFLIVPQRPRSPPADDAPAPDAARTEAPPAEAPDPDSPNQAPAGSGPASPNPGPATTAKASGGTRAPKT